MAPRKKRRKPSPGGLALLHLRSRRDWTQKELADRLGWTDESLVSNYERGGRPLHREHLVSIAAVLGYPPEAVDLLMQTHGWIEPPLEPVGPSSPVDPTPEELGAIHLTILTATAVFMEGVRRELVRRKRERKAEVARQNARELWPRLKATPRQDQRDLVAVLPAFQSWALAVHVCEASVKAAAHRPEDALHLADLAVFIATKSPGAESWRSRLEGFCWAHLANARRVANDFAGADKAFARAWKLWGAGADSAPDLLPGWRMLDLEASLRREQHRFQEALELLTQARAIVGANSVAVARLLLQKEHVLEQIGDVQGTLDTLLEAAPFVEISKDTRLLFALLFETAKTFCYLGHLGEVAARLPRVRELAVQQGNELDLIRVLWLEARLEAGQGRRQDAMARLEQIRRDFIAYGLPYDSARASLELAILYLEEGHPQAVKALAREMAPIFQSQGIHREAVAALKLFYEAALQETVTLELAQHVLAEVSKAQCSAPPQPLRQRGRE
jgi:transcriptional regulator with XRE-family HTH domain